MTSFDDKLQQGIQHETEKFALYYRWLEQHMPPSFFEEVDHEHILLITHSLMGFDLQEFFSTILFKNKAIALCLDSPDADLQILKHFRQRWVQNYRTFVSNAPPPFTGIKLPLRVAVIHFSQLPDQGAVGSLEKPQEVFEKLKERHPELTFIQFENLLK